MKRRQAIRPVSALPVPPACDRRLGFGLYLAYAMGQLNMPEPTVTLDLSTCEGRAASPGIISTLCYCREHGITGAA